MKLRLLLLSLFSLLFVSAGAIAHDDDKPLTDIPLVWAPSNSIADFDPKPDLSSIMDVKLQIDKFKDVRDNPSAIGENREDADKPKPVTTKDDVGAWVSDNLNKVLQTAGMNVVKSGGDVVLDGEVRALFSTETGRYSTDVTLRITAKNAAGKTLWSGIALGHDSHFGRSYKAENYYQNLSDGVMDALQNLLNNKDFMTAIKPK
jgi:hypothetical protein